MRTTDYVHVSPNSTVKIKTKIIDEFDPRMSVIHQPKKIRLNCQKIGYTKSVNLK